MNREETLKILAVLKAAYPHSFKDMTKESAWNIVDLWTMMFADEPYEAVGAAVRALIAVRKEGYSPTVGEVKERLQMLREADSVSEQAAWAMVSNACRNGLYGYKEEFEKLPEDVQRAVGAPEQLRAWARMDAETVESVVASNFMRNYRAQTQRDKENAKLPAGIREMISGAADRMKLTE